MFTPTFRITPPIANSLLSVEAARAATDRLTVDSRLLENLRAQARLHSVQQAVRLDGAAFSETAVRNILAGESVPGREAGEGAVRNYHRALEYAEILIDRAAPLRESDVQRLQALAMTGRVQAVQCREDASRHVRDLLAWINTQIQTLELPPPITAAITRHRYEEIQPYSGGNGNVARLLSMLVLQLGGYGFKGVLTFSADNPAYNPAYNNDPALSRDADATRFIAQFCTAMAGGCVAAQSLLAGAGPRLASTTSRPLRQLDPRQRRLFEVFRDLGTATALEIAARLGLSRHTVADLCRRWVAEGLLAVSDPSCKNRAYRLAPQWEQLIAGEPALEPVAQPVVEPAKPRAMAHAVGRR